MRSRSLSGSRPLELLIRRTSSESKLRQGLYRFVDWRYRRRALSPPTSGVPPASLRFRVHGELDLDDFLETGRRCSQDLRDAMAYVGRDLGSFERVLDFGCGCARTLRWFSPWSERLQLHGTDIDEDAVAWCRRSIPFARFSVNSELPPLAYPDGHFDLVYAISVFTHLTEELQFRWLEELCRVTARNGYVLLTLRGSYYTADMTPDDLRELRTRGFVFSRMPKNMQDVFPDWYQLATHTEDYVRRTYARFAEVVHHLPAAMDGCQDVVILRRR